MLYLVTRIWSTKYCRTKWNECLSPMLFNLFHNILFNNEVRAQYALPEVSQMGDLFRQISNSTFMLLSIKRVNLGMGILLKSKFGTERRNWSEYKKNDVNKGTWEWLERCQEILDGNVKRCKYNQVYFFSSRYIFLPIHLFYFFYGVVFIFNLK